MECPRYPRGRRQSKARAVSRRIDHHTWLHGLGQERDKSRRFLTFASKYCHFFISADRFPILDDFAGDALTYHLGRCGRSHYRRRSFNYLTYVADVDRVLAAAGLNCSYVEADRYLWLLGQRLRLRAGDSTGKTVLINGEVRGLIKATDAPAGELLRVALPG